MTTTNPVPSNDPTDLLFNAQKLDQVVNGSAQYYTDRLGVNRRTVEGISAAADVVLGGIGYAPPVAYASGISLTLTTQTVEYSGEIYAPKVASLPFTTSTWATDSAKFRLIQGVAATDLASSGGAAMVGYMPAGTGAVATTVQAKLRETVSVIEYSTIANAINRAVIVNGHVVLSADTTIRVPTDASTLQIAFDRVRADSKYTITVLIESGHVLTAPLILIGGNYSNFVISSEDDTVFVQNGSLHSFSDRTIWKPVFGADFASIYPKVNVKVDLRTYVDSSGNRTGSGFIAVRGSVINIGSTGGALGGYQGCIAFDGSVINCASSDFQYSIEAGITAWSNSTIYAKSANASFSEKYGVRATEGSSVCFSSGIATDCGRHAARAVTTSFLDVSSADLQRSATNGVYARHACVVNANYANFSYAGFGVVQPDGEISAGVYAIRGSTVTAIESTANNCVKGYYADSASSIACAVSQAKNCTEVSVLAEMSSTVDASYLIADGTIVAAIVDSGSTANLEGLNGVGAVSGIIVKSASKANCDNVKLNHTDYGLTVNGGSSASANLAEFKSSTASGIRCIGSTVSAIETDCSDSAVGFLAAQCGKIDAASGVANNCTNGVYSQNGAIINFSSGSATGCVIGVRAKSGNVTAYSSNLTAATNNGVFAEKGSDVSLASANCRKTSVDSSSDITCLSGSIIRLALTTGGVNITKNTASSSGLILG